MWFRFCWTNPCQSIVKLAHPKFSMVFLSLRKLLSHQDPWQLLLFSTKAVRHSKYLDLKIKNNTTTWIVRQADPCNPDQAII